MLYQSQHHINTSKNMARYKQVVRPHRRLQLANFNKMVYFEVETIAPPPSKPAVVFSLNEGDAKITLPDVINSKILEYSHWSDIFTLRSLSDNQKREIDVNKRLIFDLTMQRLDEIIRKLNVKTKANAHRFVLKNRVNFMADDRTLTNGYIVHFSKEYVSIVHCDDVFDEGAVVKKMGNAKVNHVRPFVGEVEETANNFDLLDSRLVDI